MSVFCIPVQCSSSGPPVRCDNGQQSYCTKFHTRVSALNDFLQRARIRLWIGGNLAPVLMGLAILLYRGVGVRRKVQSR